MALLGRDFEVHYAADPDEAQLLAAETDGQINAVLFTASLDLERIPDFAERLGVPTDALIPFGLRPPKPVVRALRHHGVRWHLWDDPADESVRFVISGVLHDHDPFELRYHLRVPTRIPAHFILGEEKAATTLRDLGLGGACLSGGMLGQEGDEGELSFALGSQEVSLRTRTMWIAPDENVLLSVGGVSFLEIDYEAGQALDAYMTSVIARHRIISDE